jgi:hypothetical protein
MAVAVGAVLFLTPSVGFATSASEGDGAGATPPLGEWRVGPVVNKDGAFVYCIAEARFTNGTSLVIGRSPKDEFNLAVGMPEANLKKGAAWPVQVVVDGSVKRDRQAVAADPDMLVIANGADNDLYEAITHGTELTVVAPSDTIRFQLKGTGTALRDLRSCVERARDGQPVTPLGRLGGSSAPQLPPLLKELLNQAGFRKIDLLPLSSVPPGHGNVSTLWRVGPVLSGIATSNKLPGDTLSSLSEAYVARLKPQCGDDFDVKWGEPENLPVASIRTSEIRCQRSSGAVHVALTFDLGRGGLLQVFFHEAPEEEAADKDRDAIAEVLRRLANP